jgi:glucosamine--fructose-6-phosphate aminotransferase (isomerizing)
MTKQYHFIKEIREQPGVLRASLEAEDGALKELAQKYAGKIDRIVLTGCGDPYMLAIAAAYALEKWTGVTAEAVEAAELTLYRNAEQLNERTLVILITSSGKTVKVIDAARIAKQRGAQMFALTNRNPSPITEETDNVIQTRAGWSDSFPTKQTTTGLALLQSLALHWAEAAKSMPSAQIAALRAELVEKVPAAMERALGLEGTMQEIANDFLQAPIYQFIGSGPNLATALLGAAKIKETSQSRAEACNLEEFAHLHGLSMQEGDPVLIVSEPGLIGERNRLIGKWIHTNGAVPIVVGAAAEREAWKELHVRFVEVADHDELFGPLISLLPLQLFAYFIAVGKQRNPDRPPARGDMEYIQKVIYTSVLEGWENR